MPNKGNSQCKRRKIMAEDLKVAATGLGLDANTIADILEKYGPEVLAMVVELLRNGFSTTFIMELVQLGPDVLQIIVNLFNSSVMKKYSAMSPEQLKISAVSLGFDPSFILQILQQYGPQAVALAIEAVSSGLSFGLVMEILQLLGPIALQLIMMLVAKQFKLAH
jgi:hypothetical protein